MTATGVDGMTDYAAPTSEIRFALDHFAGLAEVLSLPGHEDLSSDLVDEVLNQAGRFAGEVLAPLNQTGDRQGSHLENGVVAMPDGFREAYAAFVEAGWNSLPGAADQGGQALPWLLNAAVHEMWQAANLSFGLCPLMNQGAATAIERHGDDAMKRRFLPPLVAGRWTGTMNLTEPQAGSDIGAIKTRAEAAGDHYRITGQKVFISYGDHDLTENILHLVLARLPGAPSGVKGITLFLVPKFLVNSDGTLGQRNDLRAVSLEHKLGIHASPTAMMAYGDDGGAVGYLVGQENAGLACMFTMMNEARLGVGLQGLGVAERAYQRARAYARERRQGGAGTIIAYPDVRRMLLGAKARIEAARGIAYYAAAAVDKSRRHADAERRAWYQALVDLLTPVVKAWCTDLGTSVASIGVQVHGGMGYIEETGAAQHLRDARVTQIYEGTNGIQASDLLRRKLARDEGLIARRFIAVMAELDSALAESESADIAAARTALSEATGALRHATDWMVDRLATEPDLAAAGADAYLDLFGTVVGGWQLARGALAAEALRAAGTADPAFCAARITTARYYMDTVMPRAAMLVQVATAGGAVMRLAEDQF